MSDATRLNPNARDKYRLPIYTLRLPGIRMYVINSASLLTTVQRQSKTVSFEPIKVKAAVTLSGSSKTANDIVQSYEYGGEGSGGYATALHRTLQAQLSPASDALHEMNRAAVDNIAAFVDKAQSRRGQTFALFEWIKHEVAITTTNSVYGPENPFKDPRVEESYWQFEPGIMYMLLGLPMLAKDSIKGRETIVEAFQRYYNKEGHTKGAGITRARYEFNAKNQIPPADIARFELGGNFAILTNIVPTAFWIVYHLYSDPELLEICRNEVSSVTTDSINASGRRVRTVDISTLQASCPTLMSTFQEVLRFRTVGTSVRLVMKDHVLEGSYLLKKNSLVMIPGPVQHSDKTIWGLNAGEFDYKRFLKPSRRAQTVAFRAFGGGASLCPGRHFAANVVLTFAAMLIMRYDIVPLGGTWKQATTKNAGGWEVTTKPDDDIDVQMDFRKDEDPDQIWAYSFSADCKAIHLTVEDS
ncbi:cytochrome P450 [Zopfia rhizophila CBS 207.26]|uniref:Cytochrome P450 n=1 Tax=Zopfia rhizophila CBS 207.26 TaxID=1314779 RepID=A0A6A6E5I9_9PEZI|nr:cytochrome P450 [Zopfia rhizophila CBS 207.26]